ncbi:hypothetical protein GCM10023205_62480 [Yinghuangia aomiensis]|uniref:Pyridoxamine 5'-phosphate oxidase N-terminal domain-containing protein n=1 Tax=Yinghuangia aomiensis TaxID=676205 RepID=A0ABP9I0K4_9ACTN
MAGPEEFWDLLADRRQGVLATIGPEGLPHLSNVHYVPDTARRLVRISTTAARVKGRNVLRDRRAVLHVPGPDFFTFAVAEGRVSVGVPRKVGEESIDELYALHAAFNGEAPRPAFDERMLRERRFVIRLNVTKLYGLIPPRR